MIGTMAFTGRRLWRMGLTKEKTGRKWRGVKRKAGTIVAQLSRAKKDGTDVLAIRAGRPVTQTTSGLETLSITGINTR
jgi:hypothetical protein